jgi:5'(3')-deoxyribonucleotidase
MKKTILIDLDDTLVDFLPGLLKRYNEITGERVSIEDVGDYSFKNALKDPGVAYSIFESPDFFFLLDPMPEGIKYFNKLIEDGHNVIILTQPPRNSDYAIRDKRKWIKKYLPNFDLSNVVFAHKKYMVQGDIFFDDNPEHLIKWKAFNPNGLIFKILYPYNSDCKTDYTLSKQTAWKTFYTVIKNRT